MLLVDTKLAPSPIHGIGVFATEFIRKGTIIWKFTPVTDILIKPSEVFEFPHFEKSYVHQYAYLSKRSNLYVLHTDNARFINHSENPNMISVPTNRSTEDIDIALRDIFEGEELTSNYDEYDKEFHLKIEIDSRAASQVRAA
ncbi:MAG: SET domain-containing protein [Alphaproteobacteria bacterium]|nr:SET domain-containing protein [Alphaproteobacteria bacterium]